MRVFFFFCGVPNLGFRFFYTIFDCFNLIQRSKRRKTPCQKSFASLRRTERSSSSQLRTRSSLMGKFLWRKQSCSIQPPARSCLQRSAQQRKRRSSRTMTVSAKRKSICKALWMDRAWVKLPQPFPPVTQPVRKHPLTPLRLALKRAECLLWRRKRAASAQRSRLGLLVWPDLAV